MDTWVNDLDVLNNAVAQEGFVVLVESPNLSIEEKRAILTKTFSGISMEALNLATILVAKGRFGALAAPIAAEFQRRLDEHRGIERADVTTAVNPDKAERERIKKWLRDITGKEVRLEYRTDPELVGGMVVKIGDRVVDGSVRTRLHALRRNLHEGMA